MSLRETQVDVSFVCDFGEVERLDNMVDTLVNDVTGSLGQAEGEVNTLTSSFDDMANDTVRDLERISDAVSDVTGDLGRVDSATSGISTSGIDGVRTSLSRVGSEAGETRSDIGELGSQIREDLGDSAQGEVDDLANSFEGLGGIVAGIGAGAVAGQVIGSTNDIKVAMNALQTQTGATDEQIKEMSESMLNLYKDGLGEDLGDVANSMANVKQVLGLTGEELENTTRNALVLRDTFDMDVSESMRAVNSLIDNFGVTGEEAYSLIAQGAQNGLNQNGDLLDVINEYSVQFKKIGLSSEDMFNSLANGVESGTWSVDKLGDAVKEFSIRAIDGSDTTVQGFEALGMNAQKTMDTFAKGGEGASDTFQKVVEKLVAMEDPVQRDLVGVSLFGTMWEDLGVKGIEALGNLEGGITQTTDEMDKINGIKYDDAGSALKALGRTAETELGTKLIPIIDAVSTAIVWMGDNWNWLGPILTYVVTFITLLATAWGVYTVAQTLANTAIWACPVTWIVVAIMSLIAIIIVVILYFDEIVAGLKNLWAKIVEIISPIASWINENIIQPIAGFFVELWEKITGIFKSVINWVKSNWKSIILFILNPFAGIFSYLYNNFEGFRNFIDGIVQSVVGFFTGIANFFVGIATWVYSYIISPIIQIVAKLFEIAYVLIQVGIQYIMNIVITIVSWINTNIITPIVNFFTMLWAQITAIWNSIVSSIMSIIGTISGWINANVITPITSFFGKLWSDIKSIFNSVATFFKGVFQKAYDGVIDIFSKITGFFSGLWDDITGLFTSAGTSIADAVSGAFKNSVNAVLGFAESILNGFVSKINGAIGAINKIPGVEISKLPTFSIPRLATGGIVEESTIANVGEAGTEAVVPLENNLGWLDKMANMIVGAMYKQSTYTPETVSNNPQNSEYKSIVVEKGAITISIDGSKDAEVTSELVKQKIEQFFEDLRDNNKPVFDY